MPQLVDELRAAFQAFLKTQAPTASIFDDQDTSHFLLNGTVFEAAQPLAFQAVIILITLEQLYQRTQQIPSDKRAVYKDFNRPYKQFVDDVNQDKLDSDVMLDIVFSVTQVEHQSLHIQNIEITPTGKHHIEQFITAVQREQFVDQNDWELELQKCTVEPPKVLRTVKRVSIPKAEQNYLTINNYQITEEFATDSAEAALHRLENLNSKIAAQYNDFLKPNITRYNKQFYIDPQAIVVQPARRVFSEQIFKHISGESSLQPVVRLSKFRHTKYYCLIPALSNSYLNENNLMRLLITGVYAPLNSISVFEDQWTVVRREHPFMDMFTAKQQRNCILYSGQIEIIFCTAETLREEPGVKQKGVRKFLLEEGRLLAAFAAGELDAVLGEIDAVEFAKLVKEHKVNYFQFGPGAPEDLEGGNYFALGRSQNMDEEVCRRVWTLLQKRLAM